MNNEMKFKAQDNLMSGAVEIYCIGEEGIHYEGVITQKKAEEGAMYHPFMRISYNEAQTLINALYEAGLRPKDGSGAIAHTDALKYHLEDMRKLVFGVKK